MKMSIFCLVENIKEAILPFCDVCKSQYPSFRVHLDDDFIYIFVLQYLRSFNIRCYLWRSSNSMKKVQYSCVPRFQDMLVIDESRFLFSLTYDWWWEKTECHSQYIQMIFLISLFLYTSDDTPFASFLLFCWSQSLSLSKKLFVFGVQHKLISLCVIACWMYISSAFMNIIHNSGTHDLNEC